MKEITVTECPRDAIQGIHEFIPTSEKVNFIKQLCKVGFDTLDMGSFVSEKAIPQLKDTKDVLDELSEIDKLNSKFLVIVANERGAEKAASEHLVDVIGFPFSISENFQIKNTNSTRTESLDRVKNIVSIAKQKNKKIRIYLSMAFGNPYGEDWSIGLLLKWAEELNKIGVEEFVLSDTVGAANKEIINKVFLSLSKKFPKQKLSAHLHSTPEKAIPNILAAFESGCIDFDVAINGMGGCPMAKDELTGNISTQNLLKALEGKAKNNINTKELEIAISIANQLYGRYS